MAVAEGHILSVVDQSQMMGYQIASQNTLQRLKLFHQQQQGIPFGHPMWMIVQEKIDAVDLEVKNKTSSVNSYNTKEPTKRKGWSFNRNILREQQEQNVPANFGNIPTTHCFDNKCCCSLKHLPPHFYLRHSCPLWLQSTCYGGIPLTRMWIMNLGLLPLLATIVAAAQVLLNYKCENIFYCSF